ncbi:hypothetical protein ONZ51_g6227 [Trametes cubensis]|uniref:Uncharacterized protein n=1 Tax=Trametes cubensis TaxID=1111947 RepID=A0AAD7TUN4_9APHY|nr:hypothetical protein ONZ51_g6227 [Trametes cubensis]
MLSTLPLNISSGDTAANASQDASQLIGAILDAVAYGLHIAVFWQCVFYILPQVIRSRTRGAIGRLVYVVTMFLIGTTYFVSNTKLALLMFVDHRLYPGGPSSWLTSHTENIVNVIDIVTFMLCTFLADGMLLWRTYVLWDYRKAVMLLPFLLYLTATALSVPTFLQLTRPHMSILLHTSTPFMVLYFSISISTTTLLHILLVGRLAYMSYHSRWKGSAATYVSIYAMIIESAVPYAALSLVFLVTYVRHSDAQHAVLPVLSQVMCINPELLILRVARRRSLAELATKANVAAPGVAFTQLIDPHPDVLPTSRPIIVAPRSIEDRTSRTRAPRPDLLPL